MSMVISEGSRGGGDGQRQLFRTLTATNYTSWSIRVATIKVENRRDKSRSFRNRIPYLPARFRFYGINGNGTENGID